MQQREKRPSKVSVKCKSSTEQVKTSVEAQKKPKVQFNAAQAKQTTKEQVVKKDQVAVAGKQVTKKKAPVQQLLQPIVQAQTESLSRAFATTPRVMRSRMSEVTLKKHQPVCCVTVMSWLCLLVRDKTP